MSSDDTKQQLADVVVGARGWLHEQWIDSYYPEDIPNEWRFGFYANEFNTILIPWLEWQDSLETLEESLDDTDDDFHLYLELPSDKTCLLPAYLAEIKDNVTGLVCLDGLAEDWQAQSSALGVALFLPLPKGQAVFQSFAEVASDRPVELVLIDGAREIDDLMVMREQLELALSQAGSRLDFIFIDTTPALEAMRNTKMIAELLGA